MTSGPVSSSTNDLESGQIDKGEPNDGDAGQLPWYRADDMLAIALGALLILTAGLSALVSRPESFDSTVRQVVENKSQLKALDANSEEYAAQRKKNLAQQAKLEAQISPMPLKPWLARPGDWKGDPRTAFFKSDKSILPALAATFVGLLLVFSVCTFIQGHSAFKFAIGFAGLFGLSLFAYVLAGQEVIKTYNLEYALWAVLLGLLISNTVGTPKWLSTATRTEFYIKTGLVMLGAEVLFNKLLALGLPGIFVAWIVTPIVLVSTYLFGQYVLKIPSKSLNLVISADMSVCG
ncbi:MAG: putative sulfate exporter family transporter, partial [Pirellula sp.]